MPDAEVGEDAECQKEHQPEYPVRFQDFRHFMTEEALLYYEDSCKNPDCLQGSEQKSVKNGTSF